MNTNINDIESRFTHDTVLYEDSELRALIEQLNSVHNLIIPPSHHKSVLYLKRNHFGLGRLRKNILDLKILSNNIKQTLRMQLVSYTKQQMV